MTNSVLQQKTIKQLDGQMAVVAHVDYPEHWEEMAEYLIKIPLSYHLFISLSHANHSDLSEQILEDFPEATIQLFPPQGRDLLPFASLLPELRAKGYKLVCKVSTLDEGLEQGDIFRQLRLRSILGTPELISLILNHFAEDPYLGLAGSSLLYKSNQALRPENRDIINMLWQMMPGTGELPGDWGFFAGSCFWARTEALEPLAEAAGKLDDKKDKKINESQLANALERLFAVSMIKAGSVLGLVKGEIDAFPDQRLVRVIPPGQPSTESIEQTCLRQKALIARRQADLIHQSGYFNESWYLSAYPDVANEGMDPVLHYVMFGAEEARLPNPLFDPEEILKKHRALDPAGLSPGAYFIRHLLNHQLTLRNRHYEQQNYDHFMTFEQYLRAAMLDSQLIRPPLSEQARRVIAYMNHQKNCLVEKYRDYAQADLVSVIMPAYNRAHLIEEAIASVQNQSYQNWELIVVDDNSTDNTAEVVAKINEKRLRLIRRSENGGQCRARNDGLEAAKGQWLAYLDTDDLWDPDFLLIMVNELQANPGFKAAYSAQLVWKNRPTLDQAGGFSQEEETKLRCLRFGPFNRSLLENHNRINTASFVHHRSLYEQYGGWPDHLRRFVDWHLILRYTAHLPPLSIPALLSHNIDDRDENRITVKEDLIPAYEGIDRLLFPFNLLDSFAGSRQPALANLKLSAPISGPRPTNNRRAVTIIIPGYEALEYLRLCIESIYHYSTNFEIIVVDNCSGPAVRSYLESLENERKAEIIFNDGNYGFSYAVNRGILKANPENDIILINNDALVTPGWLEALGEVVENVPDLGLAVPRQVLLPGEKTIPVHLPKAIRNREVDVNLSAHHKNVLNPVFDRFRGFVELTFAPFFCVYLPRDTINQAGLLDQKNGPHYRSDRLYCDVVRSFHNKRIIYTPHAKVYHFHQRATRELKENNPEMYRALFWMNDWEKIKSEAAKNLTGR